MIKCSSRALTSAVCFTLLTVFGFTKPCAASTTWLHTSKNTVRTSSNIPWVGHGANLPDSRSNSSCYDDSGNITSNPNLALKRLSSLISMGANLIRLPLESDRRANGIFDPNSNVLDDPNYLNGIVRIVTAINAIPNVYVLVSMWHDPTLEYDPKAKTYSGLPTAATDAVYDKLVDTFHSFPSVMYGVTNEPPEKDSDDPSIWAAMNHAVATIRSREAMYSDPPHLITVQGPNYTNDVSYYVQNPIQAGNGSNIIYEAHIYDQNSVAPLLAASQTIPVLAGEYGPAYAVGQSPNDWQNGYKDPYGNAFSLPQVTTALQQFRAHNISFTAWSYHQVDPPNMLVNTPSDPGYSYTCNDSSPIPALSSFGAIVAQDLAKPYRATSVQAAIDEILF